MRNKKPPNFSTHFEQETLAQIEGLQKMKPFLTSKKAVIAYCVEMVCVLEKETVNNEGEKNA